MLEKFIDQYGTIATLKHFTDDTWYVDMGCILWNRLYKSRKCAINYLTKNGYKKVRGERHA